MKKKQSLFKNKLRKFFDILRGAFLMKISSKFAVILLGKVDFLRLFKFNFLYFFAESLSSTCFFFYFFDAFQ